MNYPLITEYIEAIKSAEDNFEELKNLRPVLDEDGEPVMTNGSFSVVFKMKDEQTGKLHAVKCFLKEQEGRAEAYRLIAEELEYVSSTFLTPIKYLDKELFVDTNASNETEFPILLMEWVEGQTLDKYIREHIDDEYELQLLAYQFSRLAMWLMPQPFAHGDLKPDNILVRDDGTLVLVDYDGMYVPAMKGQKARELGSPDFRHPSRAEDDFDEHIDDFSLASILLSLKAISLQPELLEQYGASDRLLFSEKDYRNLSESNVIDALKELMQEEELITLQSTFIIALTQKNLSLVSFRIFNLNRPKEPEYEDLSIEVSKEDLANAWVDGSGARYSEDWTTLLKGPNRQEVERLVINSDNYKFDGFWLSHPINSRNGGIVYWCSLDDFEDGCLLYLSRNIWENLDEVNKETVWNRISNGSYIIGEARNRATGEWLMTEDNKPVMMITESHHYAHGDWDGNCYSSCRELDEKTEYSVKSGTISIKDGAFSNCKSLKRVTIPDSVKYVSNKAFYGCDSLKHIIIPAGTRRKFEQLLNKYVNYLKEESDDTKDDLPF